MIKATVRKIIIVIAIVIAIAGLYFGAYLPFKKSRAFISVVRSPQSITSVDELKRAFDGVIDINSPVARDETVGFIIDQLLNVIRSRPAEEVAGVIIAYAEEIASPVLENPSSPELTKVILKMGAIYQVAWSIYQNENYAARAENFYLKGLAISPNRPQFLYGLFDLYLSMGRLEAANEIGSKIARLWPADAGIVKKLEQLKDFLPQ